MGHKPTGVPTSGSRTCHHPCGQQDSRSREYAPGSAVLIIPQESCAILSRILGWVGGGFPPRPKANTSAFAPVMGVLFFFPQGTTRYASFGPDVQISASVHPARNTTTIIYLSFQHLSSEEWPSHGTSVPANQETQGEAPHASPERQAIYRLLDFKP